MTVADPATPHYRLELTLGGLLPGAVITIVFMGANTAWA